jgi:hypothetical protein
MFEADSQLKLLPPSILDMYKVFEHIDILSICVVNWHTVDALNSYTHTPWQRLPLVRVVALVALASALATLASLIALASSPALCWHHGLHCACIATLVVLALLTLMRWCCHCLRCGLPYRPQLSTCQLNEGKDACKSTARC